MRAFALDLRSLALFRAALGALLVADALDRAAHWRVFYTDAGPWPADAARAATSWSLCDLSSHPAWSTALLAAQLVAAVALALGAATRAMAAASWALLVSFHARNGLVLSGGDMELRLLVFWGMFLPLGARGSLDARRGRAHPEAGVACSGATAALTLQVAAVYVTSALLKSDPAWWPRGTALGEALRLRSYTWPTADALAAWPTATRLLTRATWWLELVGPAALLVPWRRDAVRVAVPLAFALLHAGIGLTFRIGLFPLVGIAGWLPFLPGALWERLGAAPAPRGQWPTPRWVSALALALAALALSCATRPWLPSMPPPPLHRLAGLLRLDQRWDLFAPRPLQTDGWFALEADTDDGRTVDLLTGAAPTERSAASLRGWYASHRWRRWYASLRRPERAEARRRFAAWARARWERSHPRGPRVLRVRLVRETVSVHDGARDAELLDAWGE